MYQPYWGSYVGGSDNEYLYGSKNSKLTIIESLEGNGKKFILLGLVKVMIFLLLTTRQVIQITYLTPI